jgi:hypothetical protein
MLVICLTNSWCSAARDFDIKKLSRGSRVFFPVYFKGAGLGLVTHAVLLSGVIALWGFWLAWWERKPVGMKESVAAATPEPNA